MRIDECSDEGQISRPWLPKDMARTHRLLRRATVLGHYWVLQRRQSRRRMSDMQSLMQLYKETCSVTVRRNMGLGMALLPCIYVGSVRAPCSYRWIRVAVCISTCSKPFGESEVQPVATGTADEHCGDLARAIRGS